MARLSTRISRFFTPSPRSRCTARSASLKSTISNPIIPDEDDTHPLLIAAHVHTTSTSSSIYTLSDSELHDLEQAHLRRTTSAAIDAIIACYSSAPTARAAFADAEPHCTPTSAASLCAAASTRPDASQGHCAPSSAPIYSSRAAGYCQSPPARLQARLECFRDTPPPAPGWDKVSFGRETGCLGLDAFSDVSRPDVRGVQRSGRCGDGVGEERAGRRRDWRGEFARRGVGGGGYAVL